MALLPGIDPNDLRKCLSTFNFMVHFINMIPLINSSEAYVYHKDLTEEEHVVCEATAGFEDFVMQLFDRLSLWVESNSLEFTRLEQIEQDRKSKTELVAENSLMSVVVTVLTQCSPEIFQVRRGTRLSPLPTADFTRLFAGRTEKNLQFRHQPYTGGENIRQHGRGCVSSFHANQPERNDEIVHAAPLRHRRKVAARNRRCCERRKFKRRALL